jgi:Na+-transporting NADH:ubiquinone oxidoreductase subunit D
MRRSQSPERSKTRKTGGPASPAPGISLGRAIPMWPKIKASQEWKVFYAAIWTDNPVFKQILGICSALAVTNLATNTLVMCLAVIFTQVGSSTAYAAIRKVTPVRTRMLVQMLIIASMVILVHRFLQAYYFSISEQIGAYVGLIITNCIILGRLEAFAAKNTPYMSLIDGLGSAMGYGFVLLAIAIPREILGFHALFGFDIGGLDGLMPKWNIMVMAPAGFFGLGVVMWICRGIQMRNGSTA